jgi:hypothetical protein
LRHQKQNQILKNQIMNTTLSLIAAKSLPALSGSSLTYNAEKNVYLTLGYTSAAGNNYYRVIHLSNRLIGENFDMSIPDAKILYMISMLNELQIGDPGLSLMRKLVEVKPKYDKGILAMRMLMKRHNIKLDSSKEVELIELFNSDMSEADFDVMLKGCREKAPKDVRALVQSIKKQELGEVLF